MFTSGKAVGRASFGRNWGYGSATYKLSDHLGDGVVRQVE